MQLTPPFVTAMIIPTGVGASEGGYGGDATQAMNLLAKASDVLITHPNVANAAVFQKLPENALYVEGYGLDQFFKNIWALRCVRKNKIGIIFDAGMEPSMRTLHENVVNAVATVYGVDCLTSITTDEPVAITLRVGDSGASTGQIENPHVLITAAETLRTHGVTAIALCVLMPDLEDDEAYQTGQGVDPIGGIEAILSHVLVSELKIPCAHAPIFTQENAEPAFEVTVDPRAASEFIAPTFFPCVLTGLDRAPAFVSILDKKYPDLSLSDLSALVVPVDALGGLPVLAAIQNNIPVIAVASNQTVLDVSPEVFPTFWQEKIIIAASYHEAAGILLAMKSGLSLPTTQVITWPVESLN